MINILLEGYEINSDYLYDDLKKYILTDYSVAVIAFSFRDSEVKNSTEWNLLYSKEKGIHYRGIVSGFTAYGISENNITFVNYFEDTKESAKQKIENADILYFTGGRPDRMMDRIKEFDLVNMLRKHNGIVMGYSAGAVIQLSEYHISPDKDYKEFQYYDGLEYLDDFYLEVHYENRKIQNEAIRRVLSERGKTVYATAFMSGGIIVDNGNIKLIGDVKTFSK